MSARPSAVGVACAGGAAAIRPVTARGSDPSRAVRRLGERGWCDVIGIPFGESRQPCLRRRSVDDRYQTSCDKVTDCCDSAKLGESSATRIICRTLSFSLPVGSFLRTTLCSHFIWRAVLEVTSPSRSVVRNVHASTRIDLAPPPLGFPTASEPVRQAKKFDRIR